VFGKYQSLSGQTSCELCLFGKYQENIGSEKCMQCPVNAISLFGSMNLSRCLCRQGFTGRNGEVCTRCPIGKFASPLLDLVSVDNCTTKFETIISFTYNTEQFITIDMRNKIHENTAVKLGIEINKLSNVKFREVSNSMRRLLSTEAFFMINSDTRTQAVNIQQSLNIGLLNEILQSASNNILIATSIENIINTANTVPQPTVPQPNVPQPNVPQPNVPQPTIPQPTSPQTKSNSESSITLDPTTLIIIGCVVVGLILLFFGFRSN